MIRSAVVGFRKNLEKRPTFCIQNDWSGTPVQTFGKDPKSLNLLLLLEVYCVAGD